MKILLVLTAALEVATGVALLAVPALVVSLLLGVTLDAPAALAIARLAGAALLAFGIACWSASRDVRSRAATGVVSAMLLYNIAVVVLLVWCHFGAGMTAVGLWPATALHSVLAVWCVECLRSSRDRV